MRIDDIETRIVSFLTELKPEVDFTASVDFIGDGLLDSFDIILLVSFLEEETGDSIPGDLIIPENFRSIQAIADVATRV